MGRPALGSVDFRKLQLVERGEREYLFYLAVECDDADIDRFQCKGILAQARNHSLKPDLYRFDRFATH